MYEYDNIKALSLKVIRKINSEGIKCSVLTKGCLPVELAQFSKDNEPGITLVSLKESYRQKIEFGAALYIERLKALCALHDLCKKKYFLPYKRWNNYSQVIIQF